MEKKNVSRYTAVNNAWPDNIPVPSPQEAISGAKRLYRLGMKEGFKGVVKLTSGRNYTWVGGRGNLSVMRVNPNQTRGRGGWKEIVHDLSHYVHSKKFPNAKGHAVGHDWIEREMIEYVVNNGWLEGKLKREPKQTKSKADLQLAKLEAQIAKWESKRRRAHRALIKLHNKKKYRQKTLQHTLLKSAA